MARTSPKGTTAAAAYEREPTIRRTTCCRSRCNTFSHSRFRRTSAGATWMQPMSSERTETEREREPQSATSVLYVSLECTRAGSHTLTPGGCIYVWTVKKHLHCPAGWACREREPWRELAGGHKHTHIHMCATPRTRCNHVLPGAKHA